MIQNVAEIVENQNFQILPYKDDWWTDNIEELRKEIQQNMANIIVEVGCWTGHTTAELARIVPSNGKVVAVDHWLGQEWESKKGSPDYDPLVESLYEQFLSNMIHEQVDQMVFPVRQPSVEAAKHFPFQADLVFIDACHEEEWVYEDCCAWYPKLGKNGILCGDDWFLDDVQNAVRRFAKEKNLDIMTGPLKEQHPRMQPLYSPSITFWKLI